MSCIHQQNYRISILRHLLHMGHSPQSVPEVLKLENSLFSSNIWRLLPSICTGSPMAITVRKGLGLLSLGLERTNSAKINATHQCQTDVMTVPEMS